MGKIEETDWALGGPGAPLRGLKKHVRDFYVFFIPGSCGY